MKKLGLVLAAAAMVALTGSAIAAKKEDKGNGAPSGPHFTLNLVGVPDGKSRNKGSGGSVIFVNLDGPTKIDLCNTSDDTGVDECLEYSGFVVIDGDGTDTSGDGEAKFGLPNPDPTDSGETLYSLFIRGHGKVDTSAVVTICTDDLAGGNEFCDTGSEVTVSANDKRFKNVSRDLLYIYSLETGTGKRVPLFDDEYEDYYWIYDNDGLRVTQMRFYWCSTVIDDETGEFIDDDDCWGV